MSSDSGQLCNPVQYIALNAGALLKEVSQVFHKQRDWKSTRDPGDRFWSAFHKTLTAKEALQSLTFFWIAALFCFRHNSLALRCWRVSLANIHFRFSRRGKAEAQVALPNLSWSCSISLCIAADYNIAMRDEKWRKPIIWVHLFTAAVVKMLMLLNYIWSSFKIKEDWIYCFIHK